MTHEEMITVLRGVEYALIWPGNWDDIGFTEREIWVNREGYGYIACDEPTAQWEGSGIEKEKLNVIKEKLSSNELTLKDIADTSLMDFLEEFFVGKYVDEDDNISDVFMNLSTVSDATERLFGLATFDGYMFFSTQEAFKEAFEREWCDYAWTDLSDEMLACWINRLIEEELLPANCILEASRVPSSGNTAL